MRVYKLKGCKRIHELHFTPDGKQLMVAHGPYASGAHGAILIDLSTGLPAVNLRPHNDVFRRQRFAISSSPARLVASTTIYEADQLSNLIRWCDPRQQPVDWFAKDLKISWPVDTFSIHPYTLALSTDGNRLLIAYGWPGLPSSTQWKHHLADCRLDSQKSPTTIELETWIGSLAIAPDGTRWAMSQGDDQMARVAIYKKLGGKPLIEAEVPGLRVGKTAFSPDGRYFAALNNPATTVILLTADRLATVGILETNSKKRVSGFAFRPDGTKIVTCAGDGTIRVWDTARAELNQSYDWNIGPVTAVAFSADGTLCAAGGKGGHIAIWDVD